MIMRTKNILWISLSTILFAALVIVHYQYEEGFFKPSTGTATDQGRKFTMWIGYWGQRPCIIVCIDRSQGGVGSGTKNVHWGYEKFYGSTGWTMFKQDSFEWSFTTKDGYNGKVLVRDEEFDAAKGHVFLVKTTEEEQEVVQLDYNQDEMLKAANSAKDKNRFEEWFDFDVTIKNYLENIPESHANPGFAVDVY